MLLTNLRRAGGVIRMAAWVVLAAALDEAVPDALETTALDATALDAMALDAVALRADVLDGAGFDATYARARGCRGAG
jgi:hypothetical protein